MQTVTTVLEHHLTKLIEEEIERLRDNLESCTSESLGQFKFVQGKISALRYVQNDLLPEANKRLEQTGR